MKNWLKNNISSISLFLCDLVSLWLKFINNSGLKKGMGRWENMLCSLYWGFLLAQLR